MTPDDLCELLGIGFSDQQLAAITAPLAPGVIVAGAGSGKTTAMAARVVWLVGTGQVRPDQVLGLTFTKKAAAELDGRIRAALAQLNGAGHPRRWPDEPDECGEPVVSTYHAFAGALIAEHGLRVGVEPDVRVLADATRFQLAGRVVRRSKGPIRHASHHVPTLVNSLLALDGELADHLVRPADVRSYDEALRAEVAAVAKPVAGVRTIAETALKRAEILQLVEEYQALKADRGVLDFADQMALGARLAEECAEVGRIERDRYRVVLLDEYQDTSVSQRRMLSALFSGADGLGHPVTAVGDPCQAIYGWRGASVANLDDFPAHFPAADGTPARRFVLSVNRRCGSGHPGRRERARRAAVRAPPGRRGAHRPRRRQARRDHGRLVRDPQRRGRLGRGRDRRRAQHPGPALEGHRRADAHQRRPERGARGAGRSWRAGRGGRARWPARVTRGGRRGGGSAGGERPNRERGDAADPDRPAVPDRPARPGPAGEPGPGAGARRAAPVRPGRPGRRAGCRDQRDGRHRGDLARRGGGRPGRGGLAVRRGRAGAVRRAVA